MIRLVPEALVDIDARETLLDRAFGMDRLEKTSERLREDRLPAEGLSFVAKDGSRLVGTVRLWDVALGARRRGLLLGPLAVCDSLRGRGLGSALMIHALEAARARGHHAIVLVGDELFYGRFGFSAAKTGALWMPGPFDRARLLGCELVSGALEGVSGMIAPAGRLAPLPDINALIAAMNDNAAIRAAA
jgi:predicted N-acetyltransferase YhbS